MRTFHRTNFRTFICTATTIGSTVEPVCSSHPWAKIFSLIREVATINWQIKCIAGKYWQLFLAFPKLTAL